MPSSLVTRINGFSVFISIFPSLIYNTTALFLPGIHHKDRFHQDRYHKDMYLFNDSRLGSPFSEMQGITGRIDYFWIKLLTRSILTVWGWSSKSQRYKIKSENEVYGYAEKKANMGIVYPFRNPWVLFVVNRDPFNNQYFSPKKLCFFESIGRDGHGACTGSTASARKLR